MMVKEENTLLSKRAITERVKATVLPLINSAFVMEEWKPEDVGITVSWAIANTVLGEVLIASTSKGVCFLGFINGNAQFALADFKRRFATNDLREEDTQWHREAITFINQPKLDMPVHLHLKGTPFQLSVWKKLALVPFGGLITYAGLGNSEHNARATGTAIGANPVSYILPCHRAVRSDGSFDRYYWGNNIKRQLLTYEVTGKVCYKTE